MYDQWDMLTADEWAAVMGRGCVGVTEGKRCGLPAPYYDSFVGSHVCADHWTGPRAADGTPVSEPRLVFLPGQEV